MSASVFLRDLTPPWLWRQLGALWSQERPGGPAPIRFEGRFSSWAEARRNSTGYEAAAILERTRHATMAVKRGQAAFERDAVILATPEWPWPLIACLLSVAAANGGRLSVVDFGGALGTSYFSCRPFL